MRIFKRILSRGTINADASDGRMKVLDRVLKLKAGKSFEFDYAGSSFTVVNLDDFQYTIVDNLGRLHYRGPFMSSMLTDIFELDQEQLSSLERGHGSEADRLYEKGMRLHGLGKSQDALNAYQMALKLFQKQSDKQSIGATWAKIGETYLFMKKNKEAEKALLKAADTFNQIGFLTGLGGVFVNLGNVASALGDNVKARSFYSDALKIAHQIGDGRLAIFAETNLERLEYRK